jgi:hypothetical protein
LYVAGEANCIPQTQGLGSHAEYLRVSHEIILLPGEQYTLAPDTFHWFRAGAEGAVVSEFSSPSTDGNDIFTDPRIKRLPVNDMRLTPFNYASVQLTDSMFKKQYDEMLEYSYLCRTMIIFTDSVNAQGTPLRAPSLADGIPTTAVSMCMNGMRYSTLSVSG